MPRTGTGTSLATMCDASLRTVAGVHARSRPVRPVVPATAAGPALTVMICICQRKETDVVIGGILLILLGAFTELSILYTIGVILLIIGVVLWILGTIGRAVGPRRHYW